MNEQRTEELFRKECEKLLELRGLPGKTGPMGPRGHEGPPGPIGTSGPAGPSGAPGPVGPIGPRGSVGPDGPVGAIGSKGAQGEVGPYGAVLSGALLLWPAGAPIPSGWSKFPLRRGEDWWRRLWQETAGGEAPIPIVKD